MGRKLRVGSRDSLLAVEQTKQIICQIQQHYPKLEIELITMKTTGDKILQKSLDKIGGKGLFVKELDDALLEDKVDITVHSLKDMPMEVNTQLPLIAYSKRGDPRDVLVLPEQSSYSLVQDRIGTSSQRRKIQLQKLYHNPQFALARGNIITRLKKLDDGEYSALILAAAGLQRTGLSHRISRFFSTKEVIPPAGQAILAIQGRKEDALSFLKTINNIDSQRMAEAEREFVTVLNGGCSSPIAAYAEIAGTQLKLTGLYCDEQHYLIEEQIGSVEQARQIGEQLAHKIKQKK